MRHGRGFQFIETFSPAFRREAPRAAYSVPQGYREFARCCGLVVISPSVLEKTGIEFIREVLAREPTSVLVIPGHPRDLFVRSLSLLRPADLGRLIAMIRVVQTLFGRRHFALN